MRIVNLSDFQQFAAINLSSDPGATGGPYVVPNCARIVLYIGLEGGKTAHIILVGRYAGTFAGSPSQAAAIYTALTTGASWTALAAFLATSTNVGNLTIQDVNTPFQPLIAVSAPAQVPGTSVSPALPSEVSVVVTKRSGFIGPQNRGRLYFPGFATNALGAGNVVAATAVTALGNWANTISGALSGSGYTHVIGQPARNAYVSPKTGTSHPARAATSVPVTQMIVRDNHWDTQRRRGLK